MEYTLGDCRFEVLSDGDVFRGLGAISIGDTTVRSGRLPLRPFTQTFKGLELAELRLLGVEESADEIRIQLGATFQPLPVKLMRDHSFDPIHELGDWGEPVTAGTAQIDLVLRPARDSFEGVEFAGFSYHYDYLSDDTPVFYLLDLASWELDGNIQGATVYSQSSCSDPVVTFARDTAWSTEGFLHWADPNSMANRVMTHNLPRWASHGSFDFQFRGDTTLIGVFDHVDLIRSVVCRDAGKAELKTFDKHIFDEALVYTTSPKAILLNTQPKTVVAQRNLWTWITQTVHDRARAEFGLREEPTEPRLSQNYWVEFSIDTYYKDLLPAAKNIGIKGFFVDNLNRSDQTEHRENSISRGNMCGGQEYETAPALGGTVKLKRFIEDCAAEGIHVYSWTNNDQSYSSPKNWIEQSDWYVKMEDTRLKYGGAYTNGFSIWSFKKEEPTRYWVDCLKKIKEESGLDAYLFDSFYNLGFMPVDYCDGRPTTQWRELLIAFKELQDAGVHFSIESFGPFGMPQHGCPTSYSVENLFACYKIPLGNGYTTVPTGNEVTPQNALDPAVYYKILAHQTDPGHPLFIDGKRLDTLFTPEHSRALADYYANYPHLHKRFLQEDGQSVVWHDAAGERATMFNFTARSVRLPGTVKDATMGVALPTTAEYDLEAGHTYVVTNAPLPVEVG